MRFHFGRVGAARLSEEGASGSAIIPCQLSHQASQHRPARKQAPTFSNLPILIYVNYLIALGLGTSQQQLYDSLQIGPSSNCRLSASHSSDTVPMHASQMLTMRRPPDSVETQEQAIVDICGA